MFNNLSFTIDTMTTRFAKRAESLDASDIDIEDGKFSTISEPGCFETQNRRLTDDFEMDETIEQFTIESRLRLRRSTRRSNVQIYEKDEETFSERPRFRSTFEPASSIQIENALGVAAPEPNMHIGERQSCCDQDDYDIASVNTLLRSVMDTMHNDIDKEFVDFENEPEDIIQIAHSNSVSLAKAFSSEIKLESGSDGFIQVKTCI